MGLEHRRIYQTRHSFASNMLSNKEDLNWVSQTLGHKNPGITQQKYFKYIYQLDSEYEYENYFEKDEALEYYLKPFTQELSQRDGFGLGLSIVKKIIDRHNFKLEYSHKNGMNIFKIIF